MVKSNKFSHLGKGTAIGRHAGRQEVGRCHKREHQQKSKTGLPMAPEKDMCPPKIFKNIRRMHSSRMRTARSSSRLLGGGCLPQCMMGYPPGLDTPQVWAWRPSPIQPDPSTSPWVWVWRPSCPAPQLPPGCEPGDTPPARPLNLPLGVGLEPPPPSVNRILDTCF